MTSSKYSLTIESDNLKDFIAKIQWAALDTTGYKAGIISECGGEPEKTTKPAPSASTKTKAAEPKEEEEFNLDEEGVTMSQIEAKLRDLSHVCGREFVTKITKGCKVEKINDIPKPHFNQVMKQCDVWITEKKGEIEAAALKQSAAETESDVTDSLFDLDDDEEIEVGEEEGSTADVELEVLRAVAKIANEDYKKKFKVALEPYGIKTMKGFASLEQEDKNSLFAVLNDLVGK